MPNPYTVVSATGHRQLNDGDHDWLIGQLPQLCTWLRDQAGTRWGVSGLALGFDSDWAEAVLDAGLNLAVAIPFEGQDARWTRAQKARYARLRAAAHREHIVGRVPDDLTGKQRGAVVNARLAERNLFMLDRSGAVVTGWEPGRLTGGTAHALREAVRRGMPGVHLDPVNRRVGFELPAPDRIAVPFVLHASGCGHISMVATRPEVQARLTTLTAAGFTGWQIRPARAHETRHDGCDDCLEQLAIAALGVLGPSQLVRVSG